MDADPPIVRIRWRFATAAIISIALCALVLVIADNERTVYTAEEVGFYGDMSTADWGKRESRRPGPSQTIHRSRSSGELTDLSQHDIISMSPDKKTEVLAGLAEEKETLQALLHAENVQAQDAKQKQKLKEMRQETRDETADRNQHEFANFDDILTEESPERGSMEEVSEGDRSDLPLRFLTHEMAQEEQEAEADRVRHANA